MCEYTRKKKQHFTFGHWIFNYKLLIISCKYRKKKKRKRMAMIIMFNVVNGKFCFSGMVSTWLFTTQDLFGESLQRVNDASFQENSHLVLIPVFPKRTFSFLNDVSNTPIRHKGNFSGIFRKYQIYSHCDCMSRLQNTLERKTLRINKEGMKEWMKERKLAKRKQVS